MNLSNAVFVSHPGLQHAHQLALALHEEGLLQAFWSGVPVAERKGDIPFWLPDGYKRRIKRVAIPQRLRRHPLVFQAIARAGGIMPRAAWRSDYAHRIFHTYDWWVAQHIAKIKPRAVVAYENSAYHTFRAARAIGAHCILDAPSLHHAAGAALMETSRTPYTDEINRRKDEEVANADLILTCSPLAARSYTERAVAADKVKPLLLGAELPANVMTDFAPASKPRFVFAGVLSYRKSVDTILSVFQALHREHIECEVHFVGALANAEFAQAIGATPNASHQPGVAQSELYGILAKADCLLLPSRFDSFGMVVAEAMACGTPALVSTQTGAKAIIEKYPGSGWIVEPEAQPLYQQVKQLVLARQLMLDARPRALEASREFTWQHYRHRASSVIKEYFAS